MEKLAMQTTNVVDENIKRIGELFPNCLTERLDENGRPEMAIDFDQLRQELSKDIVEGSEERYQFTWPDKRNAIRLANAPTTDTLRPCREESVDFDTTQNLYIEGDNLQVLKLLRENYLGKVDVVYIDPPYNTGRNLIYKNDFSVDTKEYIINSGQKDNLGNVLVTNPESNGRFHTDWLNMIFPRIKVAKDVLSGNGILVLTIDDCEIQTITMLLNEIFGAENHLGTIIIKNNPSEVLVKCGFVIQSQKSTHLVRRFFASSGFVIADETVCKDRGFFYNVMRLEYTGIPYELSIRQCYYGPCLMKKEDGLTKEYFAHLDDVFALRARGDESIRNMLEEKHED